MWHPQRCSARLDCPLRTAPPHYRLRTPIYLLIIIIILQRILSVKNIQCGVCRKSLGKFSTDHAPRSACKPTRDNRTKETTHTDTEAETEHAYCVYVGQLMWQHSVWSKQERDRESERGREVENRSSYKRKLL